MIIDVIEKDGKTYYILNFKDVEGIWRKSFISEKIALALTTINVKTRIRKNEAKND